MGTSLGAHLHDVLAKHAARKANLIASGVSPPAAVQERCPPFPVGKIAPRAVLISALDEITRGWKARPRHAGIGAREGDLDAARPGMLATAVDDRTTGLGNRNGADARVADGLGVRGLGQREGQQRGRKGC